MQGEDSAEIAEQGSNLSGGQKARIALARYHLLLSKICIVYLCDVYGLGY